MVGWSVPYLHAFFSNYLMFGVVSGDELVESINSKNLFRTLYYRNPDDLGWFSRKEFSSNVKSFTWRGKDDDYYIHGLMGREYKTVATISLVGHCEKRRKFVSLMEM